MIIVSISNAAIDVYNESEKEASKYRKVLKFHKKAMSQSKFKEVYKSFDIDDTVQLLYIQKEINKTMKQLKMEDKFLKLTFAKPLNKKYRRKLELHAQYGVVIKQILDKTPEQILKLKDKPDYKFSETSTVDGLSIIRYLFFRAKKLESKILQNIFITLILLNSLYNSMNYFQSHRSNSMTGNRILDNLCVIIYIVCMLQICYEIYKVLTFIINALRTILNKTWILMQITQMLVINRSKDSDKTFLVPTINCIDQNSIQATKNISSIVCNLQKETSAIFTIITLMSIFALFMDILQYQDTQSMNKLLRTIFTLVSFLSLLFIAASFNQAIEDQQLFYKKLKTHVHKVYRVFDKFLGDRTLKSQDKNFQSIINKLRKKQQTIKIFQSQITKSKSQVPQKTQLRQFPLVKTQISDVIKTIHQIQEQFEHELDEHQFKLFTVPITFTILTRVVVSLSSYASVQISKSLNSNQDQSEDVSNDVST